jgi:hypothetical protein
MALLTLVVAAVVLVVCSASVLAATAGQAVPVLSLSEFAQRNQTTIR